MAQFLSEEWFSEVEKIAQELGDLDLPAAVKDLKIDLEVREAPSGTVEAHMAEGRIQKGFAGDAPTKLKMTYDLVRKLFIERDQNAGMQAFMSGQIQVEGDMAKMMQMQGAGSPTAAQQKLEERIRQMTEV